MLNEVNVFLDTTLTFNDPFFKHNFNRNLLELAEQEEFYLYMSKVVFDETRNKFEENVKSKIKRLETSLAELKNYHPGEYNTTTIQSTINDFMEKFDDFYNDLIERKILFIVEFDNSILPILVERSIKRIKPFSQNKQEFRDAITWLSYAKLVEEEDLENCYFISNNVSDFCTDKQKGKIHPDLLRDTRRFKHYVSSKDLLENEVTLKEFKQTVEIVQWVENKNIDDEYVTRILNEFDNSSGILGTLRIYIERCNIENLVLDAYESGYADLSSMDIKEVTDSYVEVIGDEVFISGNAQIDVELEIYFYNSYRESRYDDEYVHVGSGVIELQLEFTFSYSLNEEVKYFETENIEISKKIVLGLYDDM